MKRLLVLSLCFLSLCVHAQPTEVLHRSYGETIAFRDSLLMQLLRADKNDADARMVQLKKWATDNDDRELYEEIRVIGYRVYLLKGYKLPDDVEENLRSIALYAEGKKLFYFEADIFELIGDYWAENRKYELSFEYHTYAYNLYVKFSPKEFPNKRRYLYALGSSYGNYGDYDKALKYALEAYRTQGDDPSLDLTITNTVGFCYRRLGLYDSAEKYFQQTYDEADKRNDSVWKGIASGNIGICYYSRGQYDKAIPLIQNDVAQSLRHSLRSNAVNSMFILGDIYFTEKNYKKADSVVNQALCVAENTPFWPNYALADKLFSLRSRLCAANNDMRNAWLYADSAMHAKDTVAKMENTTWLAKASEKGRDRRY